MVLGIAVQALAITYYIVFGVLAYLCYISTHLTVKETAILMSVLGVVSLGGGIVAIIYAGWIAFAISTFVLAGVIYLIHRFSSEEDY